MQRMSHALLFCFQIAEVILVGCNLDRHVLYDFQAVGLQSDALHGVVGHEAHLVHAEVSQHLCAAAIVALVGLEAQAEVGIYRVVAFLLQFLGSEFVHQAYAAALLLHIDDDPLALFLNLLHGAVQLFAAVAAL